MKVHEKYIQRCIDLANNGLGTTFPNPMVGCVIVFDNKIIGEGWHRKSGEPHAEVLAIASVKDKTLLSKSTIYVSLEPCSHFGKTPPCCDLILKYNIPNVVVGTVDPNIKVAGNGIKKLIDSGKKVIVGVLEEACFELNKRFFTFHEKKRPYIVLKWAETEDGFIAPISKNEQKPVWITNSLSRQLVHKWRSEEQAVLVGTQTVLDDNPKLTVRDWAGNHPIRIVLDQKNRIPKESHVFDNQSATLILSAETINYSSNVGSQIALFLFENNIQSVLIEGGRQTIQTFIDADLWDEARIFRGKIKFEVGIKTPKINGKVTVKKAILHDELLIYRNHDNGNNF